MLVKKDSKKQWSSYLYYLLSCSKEDYFKYDIDLALSFVRSNESFSTLDKDKFIKSSLGEHAKGFRIITSAEEVIPFLIEHVIVLEDVDKLPLLCEFENDDEKITNFFASIQFSQFMSGIYHLVRHGYEGILDSADLRDPVFEGFHYFHFFRNRGVKIREEGESSSNWSGYPNIRNMYMNCHLANEELIDQTLDLGSKVVRELVKIYESDVFDDLFVEFFGNCAKEFENNSEFMERIAKCSPCNGYDSLLYKKLESLGFLKG